MAYRKQKTSRQNATALLTAARSAIKKSSQKITATTKALPVWFKSRPAAVKRWLKNERKKKKYRSFRLQKRIKPEPRYLPSSLELFKQTFRFMARYPKIFLGILAIHGLFYFLLIRTPATVNIETLQQSINGALGDQASGPAGTAALLGAVIGTPRETGTNAFLSPVFLIGVSLVTVFAVRELSNGRLLKVRDAYYQGLAPVVAVLCVLFVISLQLLPFAIASFIYSTARASGLFASGIEDLSFFIIALLLGLLSMYLITSSVIALYIATLPGMYPMKALRAGKKLVEFRRFAVFKRFAALPVMLGISYFLLLLLVIRLLPRQTYLVIDLFSLVSVPIVNIYLYKLYRALI